MEPEPIRYTLRFPRPATHYGEVEAHVPTGGHPEIELMMAVWTPGSYLIREYERHVEDVRARATDGRVLSVAKTRKNRWLIVTPGVAEAVVSYRLYCRELNVRANFVERDFAFLNGAPTFLTLVEGSPRTHEVRIERPAGWAEALTALDAVPGTLDTFLAPDFDTLVDSPILVGSPRVYRFEVEGREVLLANLGEGGVWDGARSAVDLEKVVRVTGALWGHMPYRRYLFLNVLGEAGGGGLEHKDSSLLLAGRFATRTRKGHLKWLSLASHEHFHAWNVKRLRPAEFETFDYEREVYTEGLWAAEGITVYYGALLVRRAGISTDREYLATLSEYIEKVETAPGRRVQSLELSSFDAWIKHYRPDENTVNTAVDYYAKGAVVSFLLDAKIRRATNGSKSLDDVMRFAYERFSRDRGYTLGDLRETCEEVAGMDLSAFLARALEGTEDLEYTEALDWHGLRFGTEREASEEQDAEKSAKAWLGLVTRIDSGRILVSQVRRETPGHEAEFNVDDEIVAIDDYRVRPDQWDVRLEQYRAGDAVVVLVARRDRLVRLKAVFGKEPAKVWRLEVSPEATADQQQRLAAWLGGSLDR